MLIPCHHCGTVPITFARRARTVIKDGYLYCNLDCYEEKLEDDRLLYESQRPLPFDNVGANDE